VVSFHSIQCLRKPSPKCLHTLRLSLSLDILVQASKSLRCPLLHLHMPLTHISLWPEASSSPLPWTRTSGVMVLASSSPRGLLQTDTFRLLWRTCHWLSSGACSALYFGSMARPSESGPETPKFIAYDHAFYDMHTWVVGRWRSEDVLEYTRSLLKFWWPKNTLSSNAPMLL
jgi:hypothetical protein